MSRTTIHYDCKKQKPRWQIKTTSLQILDHAPPCLLLWQSPMLCAVIVPIPCDELNAVFAWITCQHSAAKVSEDAVVAIQSAGFELRSGFHSGQLLRNLHKNLWFKRRNPGSKSPETVDAPGFAPDASIPVTLFVVCRQKRCRNKVLCRKGLRAFEARFSVLQFEPPASCDDG